MSIFKRQAAREEFLKNRTKDDSCFIIKRAECFETFPARFGEVALKLHRSKIEETSRGVVQKQPTDPFVRLFNKPLLQTGKEKCPLISEHRRYVVLLQRGSTFDTTYHFFIYQLLF